MASGLDIWGAVAGVIGVLSVIQIVWSIIHGRLPSRCIRLFEQTLADTESLLNSVSEEGLFNDGGYYVSHAKTRISNVCKRLDGLRQESFKAKTYKEELKQWWGGLSHRISVCVRELRGLRAEISVTSSKAREALARQRESIGNESPSAPSGECDHSVVDPLNGESHIGGSTVSSLLEADTHISNAPTQLVQDCPVGAEGCKDECGAASSSHYASGKSTDVETEHHLRGASQNPVRSDSIDTLPPYRGQSIPPSCSPCTTLPCACSCAPACVPETPVIRSTLLLSRCTAADSARAMRKLIKAHRTNLMVHNVPWKPKSAPHLHHGTSAAASAIAVDRPSNNARHWKFLDEKSRAPLRSYVAVLSQEAIIEPSRHACTVSA